MKYSSGTILNLYILQYCMNDNNNNDSATLNPIYMEWIKIIFHLSISFIHDNNNNKRNGQNFHSNFMSKKKPSLEQSNDQQSMGKLMLKKQQQTWPYAFVVFIFHVSIHTGLVMFMQKFFFCPKHQSIFYWKINWIDLIDAKQKQIKQI